MQQYYNYAYKSKILLKTNDEVIIDKIIWYLVFTFKYQLQQGELDCHLGEMKLVINHQLLKLDYENMAI